MNILEHLRGLLVEHLGATSGSIGRILNASAERLGPPWLDFGGLEPS